MDAKAPASIEGEAVEATPERRGGLGDWLLAGGILLFLGLFLLWPLTDVGMKAFRDDRGWTLRYLRELVLNPVQLEVLSRTLLLALTVTAATAALALPLAWLFARRSFPGKTLFSALLLLPLILPPFVGAAGIKHLLARNGPLTALVEWAGLASGPVDWLGAWPLGGIVVMEVLHLFPILYLNLVAALANVDPSVEEAARNLGARPWRVFWRVTLPLATPGMTAGLVLVFVWAFTELGTPLVFGMRSVLPVKIYDQIGEIGTNPLGYAQVLVLLVVTALGFVLAKRLLGRERDAAGMGRQSLAVPPRPLGPWGTLCAWLGVGGLVALAALPHAMVLLTSLGTRWFNAILPDGYSLAHYGAALENPLTQSAVRNSLALACVATVLDLVLGFGIAWLCVRRRLAGSAWLDGLAMLPLAAPGLVIAFAYLGCFPRLLGETPLGPWLDPRVYPMPLLAVSYAVRRLPYMTRAAYAGLEQVGTRHEEAAANLGASPLRVVWRVTLPLVAANLMAGAILCFAFSMLEVSDSLILAQERPFYPITKAIFSFINSTAPGSSGVAAALGVMAMLLLGGCLLWATWLLGARLGRMFRLH